MKFESNTTGGIETMNTTEKNVQLETETILVEQDFRKVRDTKSPRCGQTRAPISVRIPGFTGGDPVADALNYALETFARELIRENEADWDFLPSGANCNLQTLQAWLSASKERTKKVLSKENLDRAGTYYFQAAIRLLGKDQNAAAAGARVVREKLAPIMGNTAMLQAMLGNLESLISAILESDNEEEPAKFSEHEKVFDALVKLIQEALKTSFNDRTAL
jgi:hypothetical protein